MQIDIGRYFVELSISTSGHVEPFVDAVVTRATFRRVVTRHHVNSLLANVGDCLSEDWGLALQCTPQPNVGERASARLRDSQPSAPFDVLQSLVDKHVLCVRSQRSLAPMRCPTTTASEQAAALTPDVLPTHSSRVCLTCSPMSEWDHRSV